MRRPLDIVLLAKRINLRREQYNESHHKKVIVTPAMSRILENDPDYVPYRKRSERRTSRRAKDPALSTVLAIAAALETTVSDLIGEKDRPVSLRERKILHAFVSYLRGRFDLDQLDRPG